MDAGELSTRNSEWPRPAASSQEERVVWKYRAIVQPHAPRNTRDFLNPAAKVRFDGVFRVEVKRS
jgi:hypothetical protein